MQVSICSLAICSDQLVCDRCVVFGSSREGRRALWAVVLLGRWYREWKEKASRPMEFELCSLHVASSNSPNLCFYLLYYVLYYINSLRSGGFADATAGMCWFGVCWGHVTDMPRTGCARLGSATRRVSFYASLVGGGLRLSWPSLGCNGSVRVHRSGACELYAPNIHMCIHT
jgi:hypothetical protein